MPTPPDIRLYLGHGDRTDEARRLLSELAPGLRDCRYDCWYQPQTHHTILALSGPSGELPSRLESAGEWYPQPLEWKRP
jgi:hypothetical protein